MLMASKGHFFTQMPQPMQSSSETNAICSVRGVEPIRLEWVSMCTTASPKASCSQHMANDSTHL